MLGLAVSSPSAVTIGWLDSRMATGSYSGTFSVSAVAAVASVARMRWNGCLRMMSRPSTFSRIEASTTSSSDRVAATGRMRSPFTRVSAISSSSATLVMICSAS
jgi:hypothetical protein